MPLGRLQQELGGLEFDLHPIEGNLGSREDRESTIYLWFTRFGTHPTQVNQYQTANLGLSRQLPYRCDVL